MLRRGRVNTIEESTLEECGVHTVGDIRGAYDLLSGLRVPPTDFDLTSKEHHHREAMTIRKTLGMVVLSSFNEIIDEWTTEIIALIRHSYIRGLFHQKTWLNVSPLKSPLNMREWGVTVRAGGRNLCHTYCITPDIH